MRFKNSLIIVLISILIIGINADILQTFKNWQKSVGSIGNNVKVLFSSDMHNAYNYNLESMVQIYNTYVFNRYSPSVIYIHGYLNDGEFQESLMAVRSAYKNEKELNFFAIDLRDYSRYTSSTPDDKNIEKLKLICEGIAVQLEMIRTQSCSKNSCYKDFYLVGHSFGGQCAGLVGRHLKKISNENFVISRIYALDPVGPGFENVNSSFGCISKNDATYVQVIHTNGNKYGMKNSVGHADFYPNNGMSQPGCKDDICSHRFAWIFYQQSVRQEGGFTAKKCDSYHNFELMLCKSDEFSYMGYSSDGTLPMGTYYLNTHPSKYGTALGREGSHYTLPFMIFGDVLESNLSNLNEGNSTNQFPLDRYNSLIRNQNIRDSRSQDDNSSE